jgi:hypothetical protein
VWSVKRSKLRVTYSEQTKVDMPGDGLACAPGGVELRVYSTNSVGMDAWRGVSRWENSRSVEVIGVVLAASEVESSSGLWSV